jgi:hypothetical protein
VTVIDTTPDASGNPQKLVTVIFAPPSAFGSPPTLGTYQGNYVYLDAPDSSGGLSIADGTVPADGTTPASSNFDPSFIKFFPYNAPSPQLSFVFPAPSLPQYWRVYLCGGAAGSQIFPIQAGEPGATPSFQFYVPAPAGKSTGREYAPNVTNEVMAPSADWPQGVGSPPVGGWTANPNISILASGDQGFQYMVEFDWPTADQNFASLGGVNIVLQIGAVQTYPGNYTASLGTAGGLAKYISPVLNVLPGTTLYTVYLIAYDVNGNENTLVQGITPSVSFSVTRSLGVVGEEYCALVTGGSVTATRQVAADGTQQEQITANWTSPSDPQFGGVEVVVLKQDGNYYTIGDARLSPLSAWIPPPATAQTWAFFLRSLDVNERRNSITPQIHFSGGGGFGAVAVAIITGGVMTGATIIEVGAGYTSAPTAVLQDGNGNAIPGVSLTCTEVSNGLGTITINSGGSGIIATPVFTQSVGSNTGLLNLAQSSAASFNISQFAISAGAFQISEISANIIITGQLQVGGGGNKVSVFQIFDDFGNAIGWIGDGLSAGYPSFVGAWFKQLYVGGSSPSSAQIVANSAGNVTVSGSIVVGAVANATNAVNANNANSANSASQALTVVLPLNGITTTITNSSVSVNGAVFPAGLHIVDSFGNFSAIGPQIIGLTSPGQLAFLGISGGVTGLILTDSAGLAALYPNQLTIGSLPSSSPGAGSRQFWYNPSDSNRVYFAP